ncbi:hypothetical protein LZG04_27285 [Saccharothrix sp. S26]|uniref:hypothetical protein n=1 Tax=Saccharothrix sp. S26 TaxID=2907215 RepID=UPI001F31CFB7|nr:hypothetical protein [Saccharothrix sp. S26]MCE6998476.1 hypothetical protein [Saccharothrix sp. S26]
MRQPGKEPYDMGFRDYDPGINRFLTRDMCNGALTDLKLGSDPFTGNRYAFIGGNPISRLEIDGRCWAWDWICDTGSAIGDAASSAASGTAAEATWDFFGQVGGSSVGVIEGIGGTLGEASDSDLLNIAKNPRNPDEQIEINRNSDGTMTIIQGNQRVYELLIRAGQGSVDRGNPAVGFLVTRTDRSMSIRRWVADLLRVRDPDLRVVTREQLLALRETAKARGYTGRAWRDGEDYAIDETAFIWLQVGDEIGDGVVVCNLVVSQTEFTGNRPTGTSVRRHTLHVHANDLRQAKRATADEARRAYFVLQSTLSLDLDEVGPW